jgi:hypothetical protein
VFDFLEMAYSAPLEIITGNLFLHHFTNERLVRLGCFGPSDATQ